MPSVDNPVVRYSDLASRCFRYYLRWYFKQNFNAVRISRSSPLPMLQPKAILYSNHASWWDPLTFMLIADDLFPARRVYGPFESGALENYGILRRMGAFGVEPGSIAGARTLMRVADQVFAADDSLLCITPEGEFRDCRSRPLELARGISHLLRRHPDSIAVPVAFEYAFWTDKRPEVLVRFGAPVRHDRSMNIARLHDSVVQALADTMDALAIESIARDGAAFETLMRGRKGTSIVYDTFQRLHRLVTGRKRHGTIETTSTRIS